MVVCELDKEVSGELLGKKLPAWQALFLHRVLPSCGGLIVYLTVICYDITLIYEHFRNGDDGLAVFCIVLMVFPSVLSLVFTLASPPPGLQTELTAYTVKIEKNDIKWVLMQIVNAIFFPIAAIGRYCYLIFWWTESVFASHSNDEERTEEALSLARAASPLELYLFLQAFIHSAPHAIVNILDLMWRFSNPSYDKGSIQAISIIVSCMRMSSTATFYRRFEREKICGRKYPWKDKEKVEKCENENIVVENNEDKQSEHIYETIKRQSSISDKSKNSRSGANDDLIQFSPRNSEMASSFYNDSAFDSDSSSSILASTDHGNLESDDEYVRPITIIDRVAPRRQTREYVIEKVYVPPPPAMDAPRPGSLAQWAEKFVENAENIPTWLSAPPRRKHWEIVHSEPDIPRRVPRSFVRGLEPQDVTAGLVQYLGWYAFFISRLLSIAAFINFFPFVAIIILFSHYQVTLLFLIVPQAPTVKRAFYVFLAFIYLFCLMEFKIRFRHVRVWHMVWIVTCTIENIIFTALWATIDNYLDSWWKSFVVYVTFGSMILSYTCLLVYFVLLKPREAIVYINNKEMVQK
ncbi:uncharacterized protein LOC106714222 [Papilio machaon]|uniref:uncharacterized protein LOC106714222 n=1 Tax=Papilio machaon TaxID=76193 RepID=UPI001E6659E5|nr:uncharacterized protein LOC106714222 [Papilio machaon]